MAELPPRLCLGVGPEASPCLAWPQDVAAQWGAAGAVINLLAAAIALATVWHAIHAFRQEINVSHYTEIDRLYFELLSFKVDSRGKPGFDEVFPFMVWNFIETIVDRCDRRGGAALYRTWEPIIRADGADHLDWFEEGNGLRFKRSFRAWVSTTFSGRPPRLRRRLTWRMGPFRFAVLSLGRPGGGPVA